MRIGITGGIACGKSTICKKLEERGLFVFNSDVEAKEIANTHDNVKANIIKAFGSESYIDGIYNPSFVRSLILEDKSKLVELNKCFGDLVMQKYLDMTNDLYLSFFESAIIFEHHLEKNFDVIVGVTCSESEVIRRLVIRTYGMTDVKKLIDLQENNAKKMSKCDITIDTTHYKPIDIDLLLKNILNHSKTKTK